MKKNICLLSCVISLFCSCNDEVKIREVVLNDSLFQTIVVDPRDIKDHQKPAKVSEFATQVEYIPLQTEDSVLIGKVKKLIVRNGKYYIWDGLTETIFCFDEKGNFSHKIHKQGEGPREYPRIANFAMDMQSGNICIGSDISKSIYMYTEKGDFLQKISSTLILCSFAVHHDFIYYYLGSMPNPDFFGKDCPRQCRYIVRKNGDYTHQQLSYMYNDLYTKVPLSDENFSFYKETILFTEHLEPQVYSIDSVGSLIPKYRIEFLNNTYSPSFDTEIDLEKMKSAQKNGGLATLWSGFYETDDYLFFNYAWGLVGGIYVNKKDHSIHNMGFFLKDDFNHNQLPITTGFVDEKYMYKVEEPATLIRRKSKRSFSPYLEEVVDGIEEFDNPVIVRIRLKDEN